MLIGDNESSENKKMSLKQVREKLNLSQKDFAALIGTDNSEISRIENGRNVPDWYEKAIRLHRLVRSVGLTMDDLLLSLPDPGQSLRAAEKIGEYRVD